MSKKIDLDTIKIEAYETQQLGLIQHDYIEEYETLSFKSDKGEPNATYMLAYEISRTIERMKIVSELIIEKAKKIESMAEEIEQSESKAKKEVEK